MVLNGSRSNQEENYLYWENVYVSLTLWKKQQQQTKKKKTTKNKTKNIAQSVGVVEYTDYISAEG